MLVNSTKRLSAGQWVNVAATDADGSLIEYMYGGEIGVSLKVRGRLFMCFSFANIFLGQPVSLSTSPQNISYLKAFRSYQLRFVSPIKRVINDTAIELLRPLPFDILATYGNPVIAVWNPYTTNVREISFKIPKITLIFKHKVLMRPFLYSGWRRGLLSAICAQQLPRSSLRGRIQLAIDGVRGIFPLLGDLHFLFSSLHPETWQTAGRGTSGSQTMTRDYRQVIALRTSVMLKAKQASFSVALPERLLYSSGYHTGF